MSRPDLREWEVELLRLTAFTSDVIPPTHLEEWWKRIAKTEAEAVSRKPNLGTYVAAGPVDGAGMQLSISPGRIDWLLGPTDVETMLEHSLGHFESQDELFGQRLSDWLQLPGVAITRLAFGPILRLPISNRVAGYKVAAQLLRDVKLDPETSRDFMFQINRPRESTTVRGLSINRLTKWAVVALNVAMVGSDKPTKSLEYVRLEIDVSTDKDSQRDLSKDKALISLYREMTELCREIATKGDVA